MKERDEWINQLDHSALIQPSAVAQIAGPYISVVGSYRNLLESILECLQQYLQLQV